MSSSSSSSSSNSNKSDRRMIIKFENKSNRVKGLAFHPRRPWILSSLHNGVIQLWDYRMEVLIEKYEEHDGPVRGIHFHPSQPLFVSGGDDYKIKVWNYSQKRCLFNLLGHLDYIRTVQFHHEYPWILSASDDQTIRIWNWQSRQPISVLTGHNHYVMCAAFHPKDDLVLSASLDQTVRVWDISGLRKKTVSIAGEFNPINQAPANDLFGSSDVVVKHVLEGHTRGVNWASFHRTLSLIVSGADDREVKLWRMNDSKAWEVDTMRGHMNNVSCVLFHPKKELIISNSEDKTIRVWDITKTTPPTTLRRENDRYWILDAHPSLNLIAAGHDSGLIVFKLNRERPAFDASDHKQVFYFKDQYIYNYQFKTSKDLPIFSTRRRTGTNGGGSSNYRHLHYNHSNKTQHCILLTSDTDASYELYVFPKTESNGKSTPSSAEELSNNVKGHGKYAVWVSRNRFAVLDKTRQIYLKTLKNETKRKISIPNVVVSAIFPGGVGRLIVRTPDAVLLYDIQSLKVLAEMPTLSRHSIKYTVWSKDHHYLAMYSKLNLYLTNNKLEELATVNETSRIKSGAWDPVGVFVYSTATHLKYVLPNGENGIIRTLESPIYITNASSTAIHYLDREGRSGSLAIDATEYLFKVALMKRKNREVLRIMQSKKLVGQSIIAYLHKKGFPEVALHFVDDLNIKFSLALECGNIGVALDCAQKLDNDECWHKLGVEALRQGNHQVVEAAYQKTKNFERLSFLYLITGNIEKLAKMLHIATLRDDAMGRFHNALYLGNVSERVAVLRSAGQLGLAYLTAKTHGLEEEANALKEELGDKLPTTIPELSTSKLFTPPVPLLKESNWPLLEVRKGFFEQLDAPEIEDPKYDDNEEGREVKFSDDEDDKTEGGGGNGDKGGDIGWGDSDLGDLTNDKKDKKEEKQEASGWGADDLDLGIPGLDAANEESSESSSTASGNNGDDVFVMPLPGKSALQKWSSNSSMAADLIAAGQFDLAMHMLNRQIGIVNFEPLKEAFITIYNAAHAYIPTLPGGFSIISPLYRQSEGKESEQPDLCYKLSHVTEPLKNAYKSVTDGKFSKALAEFLSILHMIPFIIVEKKAQVAEIVELLGICKEYITALRLELARKETEDGVKQCALSAYFTQCKIQAAHLVLGLRSAIKCAYTIKNYQLTATFSRRILELNVSANSPAVAALINVKQIKSVLAICEKSNVDEAPIDYPESNFILCSKSLTPIKKGQPVSRCPYCSSTFHSQYDDNLCPTCQLGKIGQDATGLKCFAE